MRQKCINLLPNHFTKVIIKIETIFTRSNTVIAESFFSFRLKIKAFSMLVTDVGEDMLVTTDLAVFVTNILRVRHQHVTCYMSKEFEYAINMTPVEIIFTAFRILLAILIRIFPSVKKIIFDFRSFVSNKL